MKHCKGCSNTLPLSRFYSDKSKKDGLNTRCIACCKSRQEKYRNNQVRREIARLRAREYYVKNKDEILKRFKKSYNPAKQSNKRLNLKYGLSILDVEYMLAFQGGVCAICRREPDKNETFHVDHDHLTGRVRGILCGQCNPGLGMFKDSPVILKSAIQYLELTKDK